jgi:hypothetical protein
MGDNRVAASTFFRRAPVHEQRREHQALGDGQQNREIVRVSPIPNGSCGLVRSRRHLEARPVHSVRLHKAATAGQRRRLHGGARNRCSVRQPTLRRVRPNWRRAVPTIKLAKASVYRTSCGGAVGGRLGHPHLRETEIGETMAERAHIHPHRSPEESPSSPDKKPEDVPDAIPLVNPHDPRSPAPGEPQLEPTIPQLDPEPQKRPPLP